MKANELMIGDWVRINSDINPDDAYWMHDNMYPGEALKVEEILSNGINPDWYGGEINDYIPEDALMPIPLTPEILEKNGWVSKRDGSGDFIYMRENTPGYGSNDMTVTKNIIGNFQMIHGSFNGISVHYVHELQHALRLCGIEKEITI